MIQSVILIHPSWHPLFTITFIVTTIINYDIRYCHRSMVFKSIFWIIRHFAKLQHECSFLWLFKLISLIINLFSRMDQLHLHLQIIHSFFKIWLFLVIVNFSMILLVFQLNARLLLKLLNVSGWYWKLSNCFRFHVTFISP